jgi:hypothetical protein
MHPGEVTGHSAVTLLEGSEARSQSQCNLVPSFKSYWSWLPYPHG